MTDPHPSTDSIRTIGPPIQVAVLVGSTRDGRRGRGIADWVVAAAADRDDIELRLVDLLDLDLPKHHHFGPDAAISALQTAIGRADAVVVVTPEYNHSFPASLKHAVDLVRDQWRRKPVAFVSYGGVSGGLRAVEQLRLVFAELHASTVRDTVSFHFPWNGFDEHGDPVDEAGARTALSTMLDDLVWWATTLRTGRDRTAELVDAW